MKRSRIQVAQRKVSMLVDALRELLPWVFRAHERRIGKPEKACMLPNNSVDDIRTWSAYPRGIHGENIPATYLRPQQRLITPMQAVRARLNLNRAYFARDGDKPQPK